MNNKYHIKTFGCQMNHSDSERIASFLEQFEFTQTNDINEADLVIFNTCSVRQMAEDRVYGQIHNLKEQAEQKERSVQIVLTGCLANRQDVQKRLKNKVDLFCEIKDFPEKFRTILTTNTKKGAVKIDIQSKDYLSLIPKYKNGFTAYVPIMTGCNNFCSYCSVPYARGRETSRPSHEIIQEIKNLIAQKYTHIILLGQNVNSYQSDGMNFSKLLKKINSLSGKFWISFISNHPKDVTQEMIDTVSKSKKVCECFHLPLQSGDDQVIQRMNRKYTQAAYLKIVSKIKTAFRKNKSLLPFSISSDIIVGFPGETRKQFLESAKVIEKVGFDMVYFGQFSPRPLTAAWNLKDNVSKKEKGRREKYLNEILKKTSFKNNQKYLGKTLEVLIEKEKDNLCFGKTRTMKNIKIISNKKNLVGKIMKAKIIKANTWNLEGEIK